MFEGIQNATPPAPSVVNSIGIGPPQAESSHSVSDELISSPHNKVSARESSAEIKVEEAVSENFLKELEAEIESLHNVGLQFAKHDISGKTMIRIVNKDTGSTIREIPSEKLLDLAAKLDEMLGILFDKKV